MCFRLCFTTVIALACGCSSSLPNAQSPAPGPDGSANAQDAYPIPESPSSTISDSQRPGTIEAFTAEFSRRYDENIYAPFVELAYWGKSTNEQKKGYLKGVKETFTSSTPSGAAKINAPGDVEIIPIAQYTAAYFPKEGKDSVQVQPEPTHVLRVTGRFDQSRSATNYFAVGLHNGKYYFCTIRHE